MENIKNKRTVETWSRQKKKKKTPLRRNSEMRILNNKRITIIFKIPGIDYNMIAKNPLFLLIYRQRISSVCQPYLYLPNTDNTACYTGNDRPQHEWKTHSITLGSVELGFIWALKNDFHSANQLSVWTNNRRKICNMKIRNILLIMLIMHRKIF